MNGEPMEIWRKELREIEARDYSEKLDATRAAIIRACIRTREIELVREASFATQPTWRTARHF